MPPAPLRSPSPNPWSLPAALPLADEAEAMTAPNEGRGTSKLGRVLGGPELRVLFVQSASAEEELESLPRDTDWEWDWELEWDWVKMEPKGFERALASLPVDSLPIELPVESLPPT